MAQGFLQILSERDSRLIELPEGGAVVGSSPHANLQLGGYPSLGGAHFFVEPREEGCRVRTLDGAPAPVRVEGLQHLDGILPWGAEIEAGGLRVRLVRQFDQPRRQRPSLLVWIAPLVLGFALWSIFSEADERGLPSAPEPPALFMERAASCQSGQSPAHARAVRDEVAALAKLQRYPFDPHDGVEAVHLLRNAHACFVASGDARRAEQAQRRAEQIQGRVTADYDAARFRLSRALMQQDWASALEQIRIVRSLLSDRADPYTDWLTILERQLRLRHANT